MNKYKKAYDRYVKFITSHKGWETTFCPYGYETFVRMCLYKEEFNKRWVDEDDNIKPYKDNIRFKFIQKP